MLGAIETLASEVFDLTWKSGVQILLLMAALNGIPASSYEVADIEGATAWEKFWKITLPTILPTLLVAIIYTIIDSFTDVGNGVMQMITENFKLGKYGNASAIGMVYFVAIMLIVGVVNIFLPNGSTTRRTNFPSSEFSAAETPFSIRLRVPSGYKAQKGRET